jgi:Flp pilus assembly protein TadG
MTRGTQQARRRGIAFAEAALVLPVLLLVTMGVLQYGWAFLNLQRITDAARNGARVASAFDATDADGDAAIAHLVGGLVGATHSVVTTGGLTTATVTVPKASVQLINWNLLPLPDNLRAVMIMHKET